MELYLTLQAGAGGGRFRLAHGFFAGNHGAFSRLYFEYLDEVKTSLVSNEPFECQRLIAVRPNSVCTIIWGPIPTRAIFFSGMLLIASWHSAGQDEDGPFHALNNVYGIFQYP